MAVNRSDYPVIQAFAIYIAVTDGRQLQTDAYKPACDPRVVLLERGHRRADPAIVPGRRPLGRRSTAAARRFRSDRVGVVLAWSSSRCCCSSGRRRLPA